MKKPQVIWIIDSPDDGGFGWYHVYMTQKAAKSALDCGDHVVTEPIKYCLAKPKGKKGKA